MAHALVCWRCGASLAALTLPLRRLEECPACRAELHVCRMCIAWDPRIPKRCREEATEEVRNKEQANFCDYFRPRPSAYDAALAAAEAGARGQLDALFGSAPEKPPDAAKPPAGAATHEAEGPRSAAESLFRSGPARKP